MNRFTTSFKLAKTNTFRLGSAKLFPKGKRDVSAYGPEYGGNMQNWEKSMRTLALADEGMAFCQVDQAGAEALIVAYLCPPGRYRDLFLNGIKPHVYIGVFFPEHWESAFPCVREFASIPIAKLREHPQWPAFAKAVAASDNNPSATRYYYFYKQTCHCVDDKTEVLTKAGWVSVAEAGAEEPILTWNKVDESLSFAKPSGWHKSYYEGDMIRFTGHELDQLVTPEHKMVYQSNGKYHVAKAWSVTKTGRIPHCGQYSEQRSCWTDAEVRLLVAIQADGYIATPNNVRFRFGKCRKRERLLALSKQVGLECSDGIASDGYMELTLRGASRLISAFGDRKVWGSWLLNMSHSNMQAFVDELHRWDGSKFRSGDTTKREEYCSAIEQNCEWVKTICHLVGKQATVREQNADFTMFKVGINARRFSRIQSKSAEYYRGFVFCPTVPSGFFVIRRNGKISITGNSGNYGIREATFVENMLAKSGGKVNLSLADGAKFLSTYRDVAFPELHSFHRYVDRQIEDKQELRNLFGYPRKFRSLMFDSKEAYAFIPQSTVGCITNLAVIEMQKWIDANLSSAIILNNCHDSYLVQAPTEKITEVARKMKEFIEIEMVAPRGEKFRMRSEASVGTNWGPYHEKKNPNGLKEVKV